MNNFSLEALLRPNIRNLKPYSSARHEFSGQASVFLDANENSLGSPTNTDFHRYPDPNQTQLKNAIARLKSVEPSQIFLGNGSDEAIDILFRMFCVPGKDRAVVCPPTYGMYEVSAAIHDVQTVNVSLKADFQLDVSGILNALCGNEKLLFICSPNNPTGNNMRRSDIRYLLKNFPGIVVVDEAYIDFSEEPSFIEELEEFDNLVVLQTFSKAWGLAGIRLGMAFASAKLISVMNQVKAPYNLNELVQQTALEAISFSEKVKEKVAVLIAERVNLSQNLEKLPLIIKVYPSDANFLLVKVKDAKRVYQKLIASGIVVRDRSRVALCDDCLRITVGSPKENKQLLEQLYQIQSNL